jgi:1-deoxy-D-xylulose-5-phosphate reductoisomerase
MAEMKNICILGSTGSIGKNSLEVLQHLSASYRVTSLSTNSNVDLLSTQIGQFRPGAVAVLDREALASLRKSQNGSLSVLGGEEGLVELVRRDDVDIVINALVGFSGLMPTIEALRLGKTVALANKETLVVAGEIIMALAAKHNARIMPIDSEHSAILQCVAGERRENIARLFLTASGGPFLSLDPKELPHVTVDAALRHPNWKMGKKITIDSATMMNKGLEVIEAHWLFGLPPGMIEVLIHPQSIIHSMVEFVDGSIKAQLGMPDMKIPIQYALTYPDRVAAQYPKIDFSELATMTFQKPDEGKFPCLTLAYEALREGGTAPAVLNAANEVAVHLFLEGKITFTRIPELIGAALGKFPTRQHPDIKEIITHDSMARAFVMEEYGKQARTMVYANT